MQDGRLTLVGVVTFALVYPTMAVWVYYILLAGSPYMTAVAGVCKTLQLAIPLVWLWRRSRQAPIIQPDKTRTNDTRGEHDREPAFSLRSGKNFPGLLSGLVMGGTVIALFEGAVRGSELYALAQPMITGKLRDIGVNTPLSYGGFALFYVCAHSLLEEFYWRWFVYGNLRVVLPIPLANVISSLGFLSHHVIVVAMLLPENLRVWLAPILAAGVGVGGAFWCWLYEKTRSLKGPWLSHGIVDAALMYVGYRMAF